MHINFNDNPSRQKIDVTTREFQVIPGRRVSAVKVGERLLGFSGEDISAVSLRLAEGKLHIELQDQAGQSQGAYQIPSTDLLENNVQRMRDAGVVFSPREVNELQNLVRLSMSGNVSNEDVLLLLDEISHLAPSLEGAKSINAGDIYPDLANHSRRILNAMPEDIQRLVVLNNLDRFGDDVLDALHFLTKVDAREHQALSRFLAGQGHFNYVAAAEMRDVARQMPLGDVFPLTKIEPKAFTALVKQMAGLHVEGDLGNVRFRSGVSRFIFNNFDLKVPDFAGHKNLESLEAKILGQTVGRSGKKSPQTPLREFLMKNLDVGTYKELGDFLGGKQGARFGTEAKEGFLHFLKNPKEGVVGRRLSSVSGPALERLQNFIKNQKLDLGDLLARHDPIPTPKSETGPGLTKAMKTLSGKERLGMFLLERMDPIRHKDLFGFFSGRHAGLGKLTPTMMGELKSMLTARNLPPVVGGLNHFDPKRFGKLMDVLAKVGMDAPERFVPKRDVFQKAVMELAEGRAVAEKTATPVTERGLRVPSSRRNDVALGKALGERLMSEPVEARNRVMTRELKLHLENFRKVALLDQAWKGSRLNSATLSGEMNSHDGSRKISQTLRDMVRLITDDEEAVDWDMWQAGDDAKSRSLKKRTLTEAKGMERYFHLDKNLPAKGDPFAARLEELGWMQRLEDLADRLDRHRGKNPNRLRAAIERTAAVLDEFSRLMTHDTGTTFEYHGKSPLSAQKQEEFRAFRNALLQGNALDVDGLFEGPFLRGEFATSEKQHQAEMNRLMPLFKEALSRTEGEPLRMLERMMETMVRAGDAKTGDMAGQLRQYMGNLNDFNQHQNLNGQPMYLNLPMRWNNQESDMEMAYFPKPNGKEKDSFLVVIHLDFENWGHLRVDVLKEAGRLAATFWAGNTKIRSQIERRLGPLSLKLQEKTGQEVDLVVKLEAAKAQKRVSQMCLPSHDGDLDVQI